MRVQDVRASREPAKPRSTENLGKFSENNPNNKITLGWREWLELTSLNIPFIKAKIDSGARTSSIHAFKIRVKRIDGKKFVLFNIYPLQKRKDIWFPCKAEVADRRVIKDSGGHKELRYIIKVTVRIDGIEREIEVSLTNRNKMTFRMLLGRTAMKKIIIEPKKSFLLGRKDKEELEKIYCK